MHNSFNTSRQHPKTSEFIIGLIFSATRTPLLATAESDEGSLHRGHSRRCDVSYACSFEWERENSQPCDQSASLPSGRSSLHATMRDVMMVSWTQAEVQESFGATWMRSPGLSVWVHGGWFLLEQNFPHVGAGETNVEN